MAGKKLWVSAFLAETVIEDKTGVISAIRLIDDFTVFAEVGVSAPDGTATVETLDIPLVVATNLVGLLKREGTSLEDLEAGVRVDLKRPRHPVQASSTTAFVVGPTGAQVIIPARFPAGSSGRYAFQVYVDGIKRSVVPFTVRVGRPIEAPSTD